MIYTYHQPSDPVRGLTVLVLSSLRGIFRDKTKFVYCPFATHAKIPPTFVNRDTFYFFGITKYHPLLQKLKLEDVNGSYQHR
jgi:hypothetical protein